MKNKILVLLRTFLVAIIMIVSFNTRMLSVFAEEHDNESYDANDVTLNLELMKKYSQ